MQKNENRLIIFVQEDNQSKAGGLAVPVFGDITRKQWQKHHDADRKLTVDQWNRIEHAETTSGTFSCLICVKDAKTLAGRKIVLLTMVLRKLAAHIQI